MANEKHLEFIQQIINRYNSNSFIIKGWTITIVSALLALSGTVKDPNIIPIAIIPIILFWCIDTYYLSNERCFVDLYNATITNNYKLPNYPTLKKNFIPKDTNFTALQINNFELNFKIFKIYKDNNFYTVLFSKTIFWFYFFLFILTCSLWYFYSNSQNNLIKSKSTEKNSTCNQQCIYKGEDSYYKFNIINNDIIL